MERLSFVTSEIGRRVVSADFSPTNFSLDRMRMPLVARAYILKDGGKEKCPPGRFFYALRTGPVLSGEAVERVISEARRATISIGGKDDLDETGFLRADNSHYNAYRLAHAFEHLVIADVFRRGVNQIGRDHSRSWLAAMTLLFGDRLRFNRDLRIQVGFYLRQGLVTPEQEFRSVDNAFRLVTDLVSP